MGVIRKFDSMRGIIDSWVSEDGITFRGAFRAVAFPERFTEWRASLTCPFTHYLSIKLGH